MYQEQRLGYSKSYQGFVRVSLVHTLVDPGDCFFFLKKNGGSYRDYNNYAAWNMDIEAIPNQVVILSILALVLIRHRPFNSP